MNNNHVLSFYTKELDKLKQEESYTVKHFQASYIIELCKEQRLEGKLDDEEYICLLAKHREVINTHKA